MKKFKEFIKKIEPVLITALPVHGAHSKPKTPAVVITAIPVHGAHANPTNEEVSMAIKHYNHPEADTSRDSKTWENHNTNSHLGHTFEAVHAALDRPKEKFQMLNGHEHLKKYTDMSHMTNETLVRKAKGEAPYPASRFEWADAAKRDTLLANHKAETEEHIKGLDKFLSTKRLKHDVDVFHGTVKWHPGNMAAQHPDGHVKIPSYLSTSVRKAKAAAFAGYKYKGKEKGEESYGEGQYHGSHVLHIHLKKGQKGFYAGSNSSFPNEHEMLLPRNTTLKIHPKPEIHPDTGTHVWHAHVVD